MVDKSQKYKDSHRGNAPRRVPLEGKSSMISVDDVDGGRSTYRARVKIGHRKAYFLVRLKTTGRRVHLWALDINVGL